MQTVNLDCRADCCIPEGKCSKSLPASVALSSRSEPKGLPCPHKILLVSTLSIDEPAVFSTNYQEIDLRTAKSSQQVSYRELSVYLMQNLSTVENGGFNPSHESIHPLMPERFN